jgi:3-oxoadipate enol-lactonase
MTQDKAVQIGDVAFHCHLDEPDDAASNLPWLVFSNSLMTDLTLWNDQITAFGNRYRILRYDQRGHGKTSVPAVNCNFDVLAGDLAALFDSFAIDRATVVGVSMGGITALRFAALHPERVEALVVSDATAMAVPGSGAVWDERIALAREHGMEALVEPTVGRWFRPTSLQNDATAVNRVRAMIRDTPTEGFTRTAAALKSFDFSLDLPKLQRPTLMVAGADDGAIPQIMKNLAMNAACAEFIEIAEAGHLPNIEQPQAFNGTLDAFLHRCR